MTDLYAHLKGPKPWDDALYDIGQYGLIEDAAQQLGAVTRFVIDKGVTEKPFGRRCDVELPGGNWSLFQASAVRTTDGRPAGDILTDVITARVKRDGRFDAHVNFRRVDDVVRFIRAMTS